MSDDHEDTYDNKEIRLLTIIEIILSVIITIVFVTILLVLFKNIIESGLHHSLTFFSSHSL